jgi:MGT family glycosyltransferase
MSRFLITCWPFEGHLFPQMSLATALRDRGHEVAIHTGGSARSTVEGAGLKLFAFDRVDEAGVYRDIRRLELAGRNGRPPVRQIAHTFRNWLVETIPAQVSDIRAISRVWDPEVVIADIAMWGAIAVVWEADRIPVSIATNLMGPLIPGRDAPPWGLGLAPPRSGLQRVQARIIESATTRFGAGLRRRLDAIRARYGLQEMGCSVNSFTARLPLYTVPSLPELDYSRRDLPDSVHYVGACLWHPSEPLSPGSRWLDSIPSAPPWVHVTEGTLSCGEPFLLRAATRALAGQPLHAILTTGARRGSRAVELGPPASNIHITEWLSHRQLLPRCAAVVTTGGAGTIMAALQAGVPLVVVPTIWDKPDNARRVAEAGVGVRLTSGRCTPPRLRAAVELVLTDRSYRIRARDIAARLARAPGPAGAAELLERLATGMGTLTATAIKPGH